MCFMKRIYFGGLLPFLSISLAIAGCAKTANQPAASDASPSSTAADTPSSSASGSASDRRETAPRPAPLVVPADTRLSVVLDQSVGSKISTSGQAFSATVEAPVEVNGRVAIPRDAHVAGVVTEAKAAGRFKGGAVLDLELTTVTIGQKDYEIETTPHDVTTTGKGKRTAAMIGGGA